MTKQELLSIVILIGIIFEMGFFFGRWSVERGVEQRLLEATERAADIMIEKGYRIVKKEAE